MRVGGASHEHRAGELPGHVAVGETLFVTEAQCQVRDDRVAPGLLGKQRYLQSADRRSRGPRLDVLRRRVERFAGGDGRAPLVVLQHRNQVGLRRHLDAVGLLCRDEHPDGAVARLEVLRRHTARIVGGHLSKAIAVQEEQAPVAHADPFAHLQAHAVGGVELQLDLRQQVRARALELL